MCKALHEGSKSYLNSRCCLPDPEAILTCWNTCTMQHRLDTLRETLKAQEAELARQNAAARALVEDKQRQMEAVARQGEDLALQQASLQVGGPACSGGNGG